MKRFFFLCSMTVGIIGIGVSMGLFTSCNNPAQGPSSPSPASLWEISKDGNSLFLGGSVHILRDKDYPMPAAFDSAFGKAAILVLEADVDRMSDPDMLQYQKDKFELPKGQTLQTVLDDAVYKRLESIAGYPGVMSTLSPFKPSIAMEILQTAYLQQSGFTREGADLYYLGKSKNEGKSVDFLEDVKIQIDMLGAMADGYENEYVSALLDEFPYQYVNGVIALIDEWKAGTARVIEASLAAQKAAWPAMYGTMIYDRNAAWMPKIENYLTTDQIEFVIVGLAHVHGQDGLLTQLKNKGYTVKQIFN